MATQYASWIFNVLLTAVQVRFVNTTFENRGPASAAVFIERLIAGTGATAPPRRPHLGGGTQSQLGVNS